MPVSKEVQFAQRWLCSQAKQAVGFDRLSGLGTELFSVHNLMMRVGRALWNRCSQEERGCVLPQIA